MLPSGGRHLKCTPHFGFSKRIKRENTSSTANTNTEHTHGSAPLHQLQARQTVSALNSHTYNEKNVSKAKTKQQKGREGGLPFIYEALERFGIFSLQSLPFRINLNLQMFNQKYFKAILEQNSLLVKLTCTLLLGRWQTLAYLHLQITTITQDDKKTLRWTDLCIWTRLFCCLFFKLTSSPDLHIALVRNENRKQYWFIHFISLLYLLKLFAYAMLLNCTDSAKSSARGKKIMQVCSSVPSLLIFLAS